VLAILTALGVGLWLSALNALYRMFATRAVPVQFWMFASPVVYPSSLVPEMALALWVEPMAGVIEGFRWALTGHASRLAFCWPPSSRLLFAGFSDLCITTL